MKLSIIEHNPSALRGYLNNPKWYITAKLESIIHICKVNDSERCISDSEGFGTCGDLAVECPWRLKKE